LLVLVVDDNLANLKLLRVALELEGYDSATAVDAQEALRVLEKCRPDIILMDIQLPGMDGLDLSRKLKADPETSDIVILAVTSYAMNGDRQKALDAGCDGYITKPIDVLDLRRILEGYVPPIRDPG
jgi:two-component system cell cycle response regulator